MPKAIKKVEKKVEKKEPNINIEEKIKKLDSMLVDTTDILSYHLERLQMLEAEQDSILSKLSQACNRLGI